jgi:hypothetical protein
MPLLHFRITEKDESINMSRTLHAQNLTLRRAIITRNPSLQTNVQNEVGVGSAKTQVVPIYDADCKGGIVVDASFLRGYEIMSNFSSNDIMIPFANDSINVDEQFELDIASEDIALAFNIKVLDFERKDTILFTKATTATTPGAIQYVDLIFQYDELYNHDTY